MIFDEADTSDLRKVLPKVLGFPKRKKPGPGKLLKPDIAGDNKRSFTRKFINYVLQGMDPKTARDNAWNDMSRKFADKHNDNTLVQILVDTLGLKTTPLTARQWETVAYLFAMVDATERPLWDASATEEDRERARAG
jgi:hypothetical protein